jgi:hypothetical protein
MKKRLPKTRREFYLRDRLVSALRDIWRGSPIRKAEKDRSDVKVQKYKKNGEPYQKLHRTGEFICDHCKGRFDEKERDIDHVKPAGMLPPWPPIRDQGGWDNYILDLLFPEKLQSLCKLCHSIKTAKEREDGIHSRHNKRV